MSIKKEVLKYLKENKEYLKNKYGIKSIALFGSVAREEDKKNSDIDLLVEFDESYPLTLTRYFGLIDELEGHFNKKVDLITKEAMKKILWKYVKEDIINAI